MTRVAASVGYDSVLDFSRFFRGRTGASPQKYREALLRPDAAAERG